MSSTRFNISSPFRSRQFLLHPVRNKTVSRKIDRKPCAAADDDDAVLFIYFLTYLRMQCRDAANRRCCESIRRTVDRCSACAEPQQTRHATSLSAMNKRPSMAPINTIRFLFFVIIAQLLTHLLSWSLKPGFHPNAIACVGKQPIMVATALTEHPIDCYLPKKR